MMMMANFIFYWQTCCQTLPPPAIAWFAEPQAEERRECEPRSASKPSVTAASSSCRLKSAAAWGRKRKSEQRLRLTSDVLKDLLWGPLSWKVQMILMHLRGAWPRTDANGRRPTSLTTANGISQPIRPPRPTCEVEMEHHGCHLGRPREYKAGCGHWA